jgi:hypothetical protein
VKTQPLLQSRDRRALTVDRKSSAVPGTTINFSDFSGAERLLGHCVLSQVRKPRISESPETKMGVLLYRSPAGATITVRVVPAGMSSRGPDMSVDMRLEAVSEETAGSELSEHMVDGLDGQLDCCDLAYPATTAA